MGSSPTRARGEQVPGRSRWSVGSGSARLCRPSAGERAREPCEVVVDLGEWKWGLARSLERAVDPGESGALIAHPLENGTGSHGRRQRRDEARFLHSRPQRMFASLVEQMVGPEAVAWEAAARKLRCGCGYCHRPLDVPGAEWHSVPMRGMNPCPKSRSTAPLLRRYFDVYYDRHATLRYTLERRTV